MPIWRSGEAPGSSVYVVMSRFFSNRLLRRDPSRLAARMTESYSEFRVYCVLFFLSPVVVSVGGDLALL